MHEPQQEPSRIRYPGSTIVYLSLVVTTAVGLLAQQKENHALNWKCSQLPGLSGTIDLGGEATTAIVLNSHHL